MEELKCFKYLLAPILYITEEKKVHCHCQQETNVSLHLTRADKISTPSPFEFSLGHALQTSAFTFCCAEPVYSYSFS